MKLLKELGHQPKNLRIIFGTDESGMSDVPHYLAAEQPPVFGFTPDCKYPVVYMANEGRQCSSIFRCQTMNYSNSLRFRGSIPRPCS